jgi:pimeloyl-ACP methyl ester carboxylesterase
MNTKIFRYIILFILTLCLGAGLGRYLKSSLWIPNFSKPLFNSSKIQNEIWDKNYQLIEIPSPQDGNIQKAYFFKSTSGVPEPLVVSLHQWTADYSRFDSLADLCRSKNINYVHPDFRGSNNTKNACCSDLAISDIDESIRFAIKNANVDTSRIYVIGASGGGFAALSSFMKSKIHIRKFSAWASICDLVLWYNECKIMQNKYPGEILKCTGSENGILNKIIAEQKSPIYWNTPVSKLSDSEISVYAGVFDGIRGPAPFTHSINFFNKILADLGVADSSFYVSDKEKLHLLEYRTPVGNFGEISGRRICLIRKYKNVKLVIFEGGHEMLTEFALDELLK